MSIWFTRKFQFSQAAHGVPAGCCGAMVLDWLSLKRAGNYNSTAARRMLVLRSGTGWSTYKNTLMAGAAGGALWVNIIATNLGLNIGATANINYIAAFNANVFDPARVLVQRPNIALIIIIGPPLGIHHIVGVYRTPDLYNGYHMFDPNFGEFRGSRAIGVRDWVYAILRRPLFTGGDYLGRLPNIMTITPLS